MANRNRLLLVPHSLLNDILPFPAEVAGISDAKTVLEDLADFFKSQPGDFGVEENDEDPADEADGGIESKCAGRCESFHHGKESGGDDDVGSPAGAGEPGE